MTSYFSIVKFLPNKLFWKSCKNSSYLFPLDIQRPIANDFTAKTFLVSQTRIFKIDSTFSNLVKKGHNSATCWRHLQRSNYMTTSCYVSVSLCAPLSHFRVTISRFFTHFVAWLIKKLQPLYSRFSEELCCQKKKIYFLSRDLLRFKADVIN
jgi:hypothetical protein